MISFLKSVVGVVLGVVALFALVHYGAGGLLAPATENTADSAAVTDTRLVDARAPYFDLPDLSGNRTSLNDYEHQPLVVVFFASNNQDGADQIKILDDYEAKQGEQALARIVAIATQEEKSAVSSFIRRGGYGVHVLVDANGSIGEAYRIKNLPTLYFLDAEGVVRSVQSGLMSEQSLSNEIETIVR